MSVLLRRICTVALVASVAGLGLMASGCKHAESTEQTVEVDNTPVIIGLSAVRAGSATVGVVATPEGDAIEITEVETTLTDKEFNLKNGGTSTKSVIDDVKANPGNYVIAIDQNKQLNLVQKATQPATEEKKAE